ncbi:MAG: hypothetical protein HY978_04120 [Candidatus Liptonbacteria bacterium]|nr:hypothetical protein [Candidatus Liptonbacteria bacterium]
MTFCLTGKIYLDCGGAALTLPVCREFQAASGSEGVLLANSLIAERGWEKFALELNLREAQPVFSWHIPASERTPEPLL